MSPGKDGTAPSVVILSGGGGNKTKSGVKNKIVSPLLNCVWILLTSWNQNIMKYAGSQGCVSIGYIETDDLCGCISAGVVEVMPRTPTPTPRF